MFWCTRKNSGRYIWTCWSILIVCFGSPYKSEIQKSNLEVMKACTSISAVWRLPACRRLLFPFSACNKGNRRRLHAGNMATDIFLHAANVSKVAEGGSYRDLPCIRQTITKYFIDMNVSHRTPMCLQYSSQIVKTETVCLEFSLKFLTFTLHTFVLTQKCPSPSPVLSHVYFGALRRL